MNSPKRLVYDVGMNNGDDVAYYLAKGYRVVGIEANPDLCDSCESRFADDISAGNLQILNCAVAQSEGERNFYVNTVHHVLSTLVPQDTSTGVWRVMPIQTRQLSSIIRENGEAYFVKIDVEQMDHLILKDLLHNRIIPPYISAEAHLIDVFCILVCMGYEKFKLVDGATVHERFREHRIGLVDGGSKTFNFAFDSAGPFGDDIPGRWSSKNQLLNELLDRGLGWRDIHATNMLVNDRSALTVTTLRRRRSFRGNLYDLIPSFVRAVSWRVYRRHVDRRGQ